MTLTTVERRAYNREKQRVWRASHKVQADASKKRWREANREHIRAHFKVYRQANKERLSARSMAWAKANPKRDKFNQYKSNATSRGHVFALPRALFDDLITDRCFYCGAEPDPVNGIDRVDNDKGYLEDNVVSCCRMCNASKRHIRVWEFAAWAERLASCLPKWRALA